MLQLLNPIAKPIADVLAAFYSVFPNYGVDILLLSVVWMLIISPLTLKSTRSMLAMQALQPELKRLQEKHRNDRQAFAQAQMDLFRERGVSPFGSCLPMLLPMPVFFALFEVIDGLSHTITNSAGQVVAQPRYLNPSTAMYKSIVAANGHINAFGLDLSKNALSPHATFLAALPFYILLLAMIATQYYQTVMMMSRNPAAQQNSQMKMMKFLPLVFGVFCIRFPAGVVLYYGMSNLCRIGQQWAMYRFDPKVKALVSQEVNEVEAKTREIDRAEEEAKRAPGKPRPGGGAPAAPQGRPRFRDLLANAGAAAEQNRQKPSGRSGPPASGGGKPRSGTPPRGAPPAKGTSPAKAGGRPALPAKSTGGAKPGAGKPGAGTPGAGSPARAPGSKGSETARSEQGKAGGAAAGSPARPAAKASTPARPPAKATSPSRPPANGNGEAASNGNGNGTGAAAPVPAGSPNAGARNIPPASRSKRNKKRRGH